MEKRNKNIVVEDASEINTQKSVKTNTHRSVKRNLGKKVIKAFLCLFAAVVLIILAGLTVSSIYAKQLIKYAASFPEVNNPNAVVPLEDSQGDFVFTTDRELKILQLTDIHIGAGWMSEKKDRMALNAVAAMISAEKPDLVIATGDIAYPVPFQTGTINNLDAAKAFATLMDSLGVTWTVCFGNHDTELYSYYNRAAVSDYYATLEDENCIFVKGPDDIYGEGNQLIKVKNSSGIITQAVFVMDSNAYTDGDYLGIMWKYDNIHEDQIQWYKNEVEQCTAENKAKNPSADTVKSIMFFHIPLGEYADAWDEYHANGEKDTENVRYIYGVAGEADYAAGDDKAVYCPVHDDEMFETILKLGSTQGIFVGHDHVNNFSLCFKGVNLTYGMSVDYLAYSGIYKKGLQRGCTVITVSPTGKLEYSAKNYYTDSYPSFYEKETVEDINKQ